MKISTVSPNLRPWLALAVSIFAGAASAEAVAQSRAAPTPPAVAQSPKAKQSTQSPAARAPHDRAATLRMIRQGKLPATRRTATLTPERAAEAKGPKAPRIPKGMDACLEPMQAGGTLPKGAGETVRYALKVDGLSVGTIDFKIERQGLFEGRPVTEYRSLFKLDSLVSTFVAVEGRAASLVGDESSAPLTAMNRYTLSSASYEENKVFAQDGHHVESERSTNGKSKRQTREFPGQARDFVTAFYLLRTLPADVKGCTIVYGNQRAYTIWLTPMGQETVDTPVGVRQANRYDLVYGAETSKEPITASVWVSTDAARLPYKAKIHGQYRLEANVHMFEHGR